MSRLENSQALEQALAANAELSEILPIIEKGIDPMYKDGKVVADALELDSSTLVWMEEGDVATWFMSNRFRAWNLLQAVIEHYEIADNDAMEALETILRQDMRKDKNKSIAYFQAFRTMMIKDMTDLVEQLMNSVKFEIHMIIEAMSIDFSNGRHLPKLNEEWYANSAYTSILDSLRGTPENMKYLNAFLAIQLIEAEENDGDFVVANLLLAKPKHWLYLGSWDKHKERIVDAMVIRLQRAERNDVVELFIKFYRLTYLFLDGYDARQELIKTAKELRGIKVKTTQDSFSLDINDKREAFNPSQIKKGYKDRIGLIETYFDYGRDGIKSKEDLQSLIANIRAFEKDVSDDIIEEFVDILITRYRTPLWRKHD